MNDVQDGDVILMHDIHTESIDAALVLIPKLEEASNDVAMQMVGVGFIIGVIQDSVETALNSAGDVEFAATAEYHQWLKQGKPLPDFLRK